MNLRPYQSKAIESIHAALELADATLLVLPTGCGKTIVFAHLIQQTQGRVLVVAHREELIFQAAHKIEIVTGKKPEIEMAERKAGMDMFRSGRVVVASKDTLVAGRGDTRRMTKFKPDAFALIIIDEAHHATAPTYRLIIDYFASAKLLGVTATPDRADKIGLNQVFDTVAFDYEIADAIMDGWLTPIKQKSVIVKGLDYSAVRTSEGDLNPSDVARMLASEDLLHQFGSSIIQESGSKKTIVFAPPGFSKDEADPYRISERLTEILNRHKADSAVLVTQNTDKDVRRQVLKDFTANKFQFLVNVGIFTEGFDEPGIEVVAMVRATKSRALYAQMLGRGTRALPGIVDGTPSKADRILRIARSAKPSVMVLDFVGNSGRHKLITPADILGGELDDRTLDMAKALAQKNGGSVQGAIEDAKKKIKEEEEMERQANERRTRSAKARSLYVARDVSPFDDYERPANFSSLPIGVTPPTDKQINLLRRNGINTSGMSRRDATRHIGQLIEKWKAKDAARAGVSA